MTRSRCRADRAAWSHSSHEPYDRAALPPDDAGTRSPDARPGRGDGALAGLPTPIAVTTRPRSAPCGLRARRFGAGSARRRSPPRTGEAGLQILDAQAARFADFDDVQLLGLVEGEWPERPRRNIFYPPSSWRSWSRAGPEQVTCTASAIMLRAARAAFLDLLGLARSDARVSTFALEADAVVEPSRLLDEIPRPRAFEMIAVASPSSTIPDANRRRVRGRGAALAPPSPCADGAGRRLGARADRHWRGATRRRFVARPARGGCRASASAASSAI